MKVGVKIATEVREKIRPKATALKSVIVLLLIVSCLSLAACGTKNNQGGAESTTEQKDLKQSYVFTYNGIDMEVNQDISLVIDKLGEPLNYYEATSCAFEGLDKIYTYASFQIDTFPKDGKDVIACIYFKDDVVKTKEGVSLYMSKSEMIKAYGEATETSGTAYIYRKGNGFLRFILNDSDEIISIEYQTEVTYK